MRFARRIAMVLAGLLLVGSLAVLAQEQPTDAGQKAGTTWLELVDTGKFVESWKAAAAGLQAAVTQEKWVSAMTSVRTPMGKLLMRKVQSATYSTTLPGVPDGEYVLVLYETSFEKKPTAQETVIASKEKDGRWRVAGYYVK